MNTADVAEVTEGAAMEVGRTFVLEMLSRCDTAPLSFMSMTRSMSSLCAVDPTRRKTAKMITSTWSCFFAGKRMSMPPRRISARNF